MHTAQFRDAKTKTSKDVWVLVWRLQRLNRQGSALFPPLLLKVNNLMEYQGKGAEFFLMFMKSKRCQSALYRSSRGCNLSRRLLLKKCRKAIDYDGCPF